MVMSLGRVMSGDSTQGPFMNLDGESMDVYTMISLKV